MNKQKNNRERTPQPEQDTERDEQLTNSHENDIDSAPAAEENDKVADPVEELTAQLAALNDTHLRLMAEYDNYRKRTLKEKSELIRNGGEKVLVDLLPVIDDFERALSNLGLRARPQQSGRHIGACCHQRRSGADLQQVHGLSAEAGCQKDRNRRPAIRCRPL